MQNLAYPSEKEASLLDFEAMDANKSSATTAKPQESDRAFAQTATHNHDEVEDKVRRAEEQLAALQQKREELEKQKAELERISRERHRFAAEKDEVVKTLTAALPELRTEAEEAQRRSEFLRQMREVFGQHLEVLKTVTPDEWEDSEVEHELERGNTVLTEAQNEIERFEERLSTLGATKTVSNHARVSSSGEVEFTRWMKMGFAFALPIMLFTALTLVITYLVVTQ